MKMSKVVQRRANYIDEFTKTYSEITRDQLLADDRDQLVRKVSFK